MLFTRSIRRRLSVLEEGFEVLKTAAFTTINPDPEQCSRGLIVSNLGAGAANTVNLPAAKPGMMVIAVVEAAHELRLDPKGSETIALPSNGQQQTAGKYVTADEVGENATFVCITAGTWSCTNYAGTWTVQS